MTNFPFDIVGFDLDGTLVDSLPDLTGAVNHALDMAGRRSLSIATVRNLIGGGTAELLRRALVETGGAVDDGEQENLHAAVLDWYQAHLTDQTRAFAGCEAMLADLAHRGVTLAVVTNKNEELAVQILQDLGLSRHFATIIGGDSLGPGHAKPRPDLLNLMLERCGPGRAAYVGDSQFDIGAAQAAGIPCVVVSFGYGNSADLGGDEVVDHFDALVPTLSGL